MQFALGIKKSFESSVFGAELFGVQGSRFISLLIPVSCLVTCVVFCGLLSGCGSRSHHAEQHGFLMDTLVKLSVYDRELSELRLNALIDSTLEQMGKIEKQVSVHYDSSEISLVNLAAGKEAIPVSKHLPIIIQTGKQIAGTTDGAFEITIGPLKNLWGFDQPTQTIPDSADITAYLALGNSEQVSAKENRVSVDVEGLGIDLGGIAKGYILDYAVAMLQNAGVDAGLVEGGGDMRVFGKHPRRKFWRIGIQHPRSDRGGIIGILSLDAESVATSGDYERYFIEDGIRYHHLLDPKTGYPARGCVSATVIAENAMLADAYATAVFIMGAEKGLEFLNTNGMMGVIFVERDGEVEMVMSETIQEKVERIAFQ